MRLNSPGSAFAPPRGARLSAALFSILLAGIPLAAQEAEVHKDVPYVPTPPEVVEAMLKLGNAAPGDVHYDLGCGDGRIVIMAVQKFGAARGTGYDIDPQRIKEANDNAKQAGVTGKVKFVIGNLFEADFRDAEPRHSLPAAGSEPQAPPETAEGPEGRLSRRFPSVRHGRVGAGQKDRSRLAQRLHVDRHRAGEGQVRR